MDYRKLFQKEYIFLYLIVLIGAFLRLQGVFTNSFAFTYDVGRDMLALYNIVHLHKISLIGATTGLPGVFYGPWWYLMLTPFFIIFSGNPQGIALTMALVGIASIILGYFFGKKIGGNFLGLSMAALISVSSNMVSLASQIWNPNVSPVFVILVLFVLDKIYSSETKNKPLYYFFLGVFLALIMDLEIVFGLLLSAGIIISVALTVNKKIPLKGLVLFILGELIIFSPRILFELRHQFLMTKSFINYFSGGGSVHSGNSIINIFLNRLAIFFDQFNSTLAAGNSILGIIILLFIVFCLIFYYGKSSPVIKSFINTSILVIAVFLIGTVFFSHDIWPHYLVGLPVFYILLFSIALYLLGKNSLNIAIPYLILIVLFIANLNLLSVYQSLTRPLWVGDASVYRNQVAVIDYVYNQANGKPFKYVVYTPPVYDYTYQYLFLWYGPEKYHYKPSLQSSLAYFILEPDTQYPSRLADWLKARRGDGKIVKSEKLPSGIVVQTRIH